MKTFRALCVIGAATCILLSAGQGPTFDVASVKPNTTGTPRFGAMRVWPGGRFTATNVTLKTMIEWAYHIVPNKGLVGGGPAWLDSLRFDLDAKAAEAVVDDTVVRKREDTHRLMLRALLEQRFKVAARRMTGDVPIYRLVVAKSGVKTRPAAARECSTADAFCGVSGGSGLGINGQSASMFDLAEFLTRFSDRVVRDATGIQGLFDMKTTGWASTRQRTAADALDTATEPIDPDGVSLFTVIEEQLGLKVEPAVGPVDRLVIEHAERPVDN